MKSYSTYMWNRSKYDLEAHVALSVVICSSNVLIWHRFCWILPHGIGDLFSLGPSHENREVTKREWQWSRSFDMFDVWLCEKSCLHSSFCIDGPSWQWPSMSIDYSMLVTTGSFHLHEGYKSFHEGFKSSSDWTVWRWFKTRMVFVFCTVYLETSLVLNDCRILQRISFVSKSKSMWS